ncbi:unnamed protein product [Protopolystoma xenopodis]|uniref:Peptidase M13 N-terminal domain-containing protein n=1 Tax=Protopolystoma xenopodis TaxID=117903 RepID=A0A448XMF2_9PLAT|nr:unnamed protein product [Protopolystoma xenopodis]
MQTQKDDSPGFRGQAGPGLDQPLPQFSYQVFSDTTESPGKGLTSILGTQSDSIASRFSSTVGGGSEQKAFRTNMQSRLASIRDGMERMTSFMKPTSASSASICSQQGICARYWLITPCLFIILILVITAQWGILAHWKATREGQCITKACLQSAAQLQGALNNSKDPCDNFFAYACGHYYRPLEAEPPTSQDMHKAFSFSSLIPLLGGLWLFDKNATNETGTLGNTTAWPTYFLEQRYGSVAWENNSLKANWSWHKAASKLNLKLTSSPFWKLSLLQTTKSKPPVIQLVPIKR